MDLSIVKKLFGDMTPKARKLVIAYAMQASVLSQIEAQALSEGVSRVKLEMVKGAMPMLLGFLEGETGT